MIQAILFDFNGVIIDDERIHLKAYREVFVAEGVTLTDEEYLLCLGMDDAAFVRAAFARAGRELTDDAMRAVINREHELHRALIEAEPPGIEAARAAGMCTVGVTATVSESELRAAGADVVTANLADWSVDAVHHLFD